MIGIDVFWGVIIGYLLGEIIVKILKYRFNNYPKIICPFCKGDKKVDFLPELVIDYCDHCCGKGRISGKILWEM